MLIWQPPYDVQSQPLSFVVKISDLAGVNIYTVTVMGLQTAINLPNPCESYEALIRPQCPNHMPINNDTVDLQGGMYIAILDMDLGTIFFLISGARNQKMPLFASILIKSYIIPLSHPLHLSPTKFSSAPPAIISHVDVSFPSSSKDNVTVSIVSKTI